MPGIRCKRYKSDGTPIRGGCSIHGCRFVHPDQDAWRSLSPFKSSVRCKHYDSHGNPINGGCGHTLRGSTCLYTHPGDKDWPIMEKPRAQFKQTSSSPAFSSVSHSTQTDIDQRISKESKQGRPPVVAGAPKPGRDASELRTSTLSQSFAITRKSTDPPSTTTDIGVEIKPASCHMPEPLLPLFQNSQVDPGISSMVFESTSALPKSADRDVLRQTWKKRISLLSQAHGLLQKILEINVDLERRIALHSIVITPVDANPPEVCLEILRDFSGTSKAFLEEKLDTVISQLIEEDIWPLTSPTQTDFSVERRQLELSASIVELGRRLDVMLTQVNELRLMTKRHNDSVSVASVGKDEDVSHSSKRRRLSANGSFQPPFNFHDILTQLDSLQSKADELEAESLVDDRLLEVVDDRIEDLLREKTTPHPILPDSLQDDVRNLNVDLNVLCGELANLDTSGLVSQIGTLRTDTNTLMQTIELLGSEYQSLEQRQAHVDQQTRKIMEELMELRIMPQDNPEIATNTDHIFSGEFMLDVQKHIDTQKVELQNKIKAYNDDIQSNVLARLEPMIVKTETMYNSLRFQANAS